MNYDVAIVGGGPIGLELAVALSAAGMSHVHFEAGQIGSTFSWWAPQTRFFSSPERIAIAGVPLVTVDQSKATREEYLAYLRSVVQQFDLEIHTFERVLGAQVREDGFEILSHHRGGDRRTWVRHIVLAVGNMHQPNLLQIPGEDSEHASHYFGETHQYFRQRVLIVGGKNSAVEAAIRCFRAGARVTLSYRGAEIDETRVKYWLMPEIRALLRDGQVKFLPLTVPREILNDRVILERLTERADGTAAAPGEPLEVAADFVLLLTGYRQDPTLFESLGIHLEGPGREPHHDPETMETNVAGIYVAGTAAAGTQLGGVKAFIETTHIHVERILASLTGREPRMELEKHYELPES